MGWNDEPDARLLTALRDDLNVPQAIVRLHELVIAAVHACDDEAPRAAGQLRASAAMLGLLQASPASALAVLQEAARLPHGDRPSPDRIAELVALRDQARRDRDYERADAMPCARNWTPLASR
ncbi:MAG: hypothetical protein CBARDMAM_6112 [uncultured Caballeronia sp.]|nr:MAG: hypothetical protein CBARDMAM_6112 [uncultured Caballeronia sp.]